jgi:Fe-S-cluster containining protein
MPPPAFQCRKCGECCAGRGGVRLSEGEAALAARFLDISPENFSARFLAPGPLPRDILCGSGKCLFSEAGGLCRIHPAKPKICRDWPYLPGPLTVESAFLDAKAACPGLRRDLSWAEFQEAGRAFQANEKKAV